MDFNATSICLKLPANVPSKGILSSKIKMLLLLITLITIGLSTFAQKITLNEKNENLEQVLKKVRRQSGYDFVYGDNLLKNTLPVTVELKNASLEEALNTILRDQPITFEIEDKAVIFKAKEQPASTQNAGIKLFIFNGKVFDELNKPLEGATVKVKGTNQITVSNKDGEFSLPVLNGEHTTLQVSFVGYITGEIIPTHSKTVYVYLKTADSKLDEVQVIGYGTTTRRLSTGDETTITAKDIESQPVNNILDALAGRIAGLQITPTSGLPGAAPNVLIGGRASLLATNVPLYIIDGVPTQPSTYLSNGGGIDGSQFNLLFNLNPHDVESITVLKDADATAIYGSRGANGVILITTKRGKATGIQVNLNAYTGMAKVPYFIDYLNVHQYNAMRREALINNGLTPSSDPNDAGYAPDLLNMVGYDSTKTHNWQKEFINKTAVTNDVNFSLSGGSELTHFYLNSAYHSEGSVMQGSKVSARKSFLFRTDHASKDRRFNFNVQANYATSDIKSLPSDLANFTNLAPSYQLYLPDGSPNWEGAGGFPLAYTLQKYSVPDVNFGGSANISYEFLPGLTAKINTGLTRSTTDVTQEEPLASKDPTGYNYVSTLITQHLQIGTWIAEPQLQYTHNFKKNHLELLGGATYQKSYNKNLALTGEGFANDYLIGNIQSAARITSVGSSDIPYAYNAVFGRFSYNYNQEFLADVTFRRDGSSKFGPGKKFGNFGAVGLGWVFTDEKVITDALPFLSFGKIRASYGVTGNDQISDFGYIATAYTQSPSYNNEPNLLPNAPPNPNLHWEKDRKLEVALELGFFKDRIFLSAAYFRNRTNNQLVYQQVSSQSGFTYYVNNSPADVQNKGIEIELTSHNLTGNFTWNTSFNLTKSENKLLAFPGLENSYYSFYTIGQSINTIKAYKLTGLDKQGAPVYADVNGDGQVDYRDQISAGNNDPFYGGIKNDFGYKGFNFGFFIQYSRNRATEGFLPFGSPGSLNYNVTTYALGRWQKQGDEEHTVIVPFTTYYPDYRYRNSDQFVTTINLFRLSNASLSYTVPNNGIRHLKMNRLQVYVNAQNLYVWDKNKDYELDPLTGTGIPPLRTIVFGINATF